MKKLIIAVFVGFSAMASSDSISLIAKPAEKKIVYYFHGQFRCYSCTRIEELTHSALKKHFLKELKNGTIIFRPVNIDQPVNEHFTRDYRLKTRSVIVSKVHSGKEIKWKNLERVWDYLADESRFMDYIKAEIDAF